MVSNIAGQLLVMTLAASSAEAPLWAWSEVNEASFPTSETFGDVDGNAFTARPHVVHPDRVWEAIGPDEDQYEQLISADGVHELIPVVESLVEPAPEFSGWEITAFRPRMADYSAFNVNCASRVFDPGEIWFHPIVGNGHFDLILFHPAHDVEDRNWTDSGSDILSDLALGGYRVVTGIRNIDHPLLPDDQPETGLRPFTELRTIFDRHKAH